MTAKQIYNINVRGLVSSVCLTPAGKLESVKDFLSKKCRIPMDPAKSLRKASTLFYYPCTCLVMFWGRLLTSLPIIEKIGIGPWENEMVCCALFIGG
jgi:hypothetical protein